MTAPKPQKPVILNANNFADPVNYCFYLLGYTDGVRGCVSIVIGVNRVKAYNKGTRDGLNYINWIFRQSIKAQN